MSKQKRSSSGLTERVAQAAADFGAAADTVDDAAAQAFGINRTDLNIVSFVLRGGELTAGELATIARLSPAATTTAIQRLVAAGYLTRAVDGSDRRRAVLTLTPAAIELTDRVYGPVGRGGLRELERYTDSELALIEDFLRRGQRFQLAEAARIRDMT